MLANAGGETCAIMKLLIQAALEVIAVAFARVDDVKISTG